MRVTIGKVAILNPVSVFLRDGPHLVPTLLNGAILRVPAFSNTRYGTARNCLLSVVSCVVSPVSCVLCSTN